MELCKHLKYSRSIQPGKAIFFYKTTEHDFVPLEADVKGIRGQKASYSEAYTGSGNHRNLAPQDLAYCNPIRMESVSVPPLAEGVYCQFNLRVFANSLRPEMANDQVVFELLSKLAEAYRDRGGYAELARRYSMNLLACNWLFRNLRHYPVSLEVLTSEGNTYQVEDCHKVARGVKGSKLKTALTGLSSEIENALSIPGLYWSSEVKAHIRAGMGEEIFPSQQFTEKTQRGDLTRLFCKTRTASGIESVVLNMEKVNAGIQQIDDWYDEEADTALRVHEYGADQQRLLARRRPELSLDFYSFLQRTEHLIKTLSDCRDVNGSDIPAEVHYVMAVLIKGGMFQKGRE